MFFVLLGIAAKARFLQRDKSPMTSAPLRCPPRSSEAKIFSSVGATRKKLFQNPCTEQPHADAPPPDFCIIKKPTNEQVVFEKFPGRLQHPHPPEDPSVPTLRYPC